jgi:hypothetical protein
MKLATLALLFAAAPLATAPTCSAQGGCMTPKPAQVAPIPPPGCKKMIQACHCSDNGTKCSWIWVCAE